MVTDDKRTAEEIWKQYQKSCDYKSAIGLYERVRVANEFYHDEQWKGLNAPDLDKPVFNVLKPAVNYYVSMLVSDDIGVSLEMMDDTEGDMTEFYQKILMKALDTTMEQNKYKALAREFLRNCAVDADACMYFYFDPYEQNKNGVNGVIKCELIDNTDVHFADVTNNKVQEQNYVIISMRRLLSDVQREAKELGISDYESIVSDDGERITDLESHAEQSSKYCTVLLKFIKEKTTEDIHNEELGTIEQSIKDTVKVIKSTKTHILSEVDLGIPMYPLSYMTWERRKKSMHGVSPVWGKIPNQIFINKIYAMAMMYQTQMAFPKVFYNANLIPHFSNKIGQAVKVHGDPNQAIFSGWRPPELSAQVTALADQTSEKTKDALGVYDAALGNVKPDNTSAIIAVQKSASQPLELQKMDYYQFVEDCVRVMIELMSEYYGERRVRVEEEDYQEVAYFDFGEFKDMNMSLNVEVGAASYWDELTQVQTLDNLMTQQIIPDALTYLEMVPDGYVKNKSKIVQRIKELQEKQEQMPPELEEQPPMM